MLVTYASNISYSFHLRRDKLDCSRCCKGHITKPLMRGGDNDDDNDDDNGNDDDMKSYIS